jgi:molybdopterin synthase sulfur carrier subunit
VVTVRIPKVLGKYASGLEFIEVEGSTIHDVLQAVVDEHPALEIRLIEENGSMHGHLSLFHEGRQVPPEDHRAAEVQPGDRLDVLVSISGGAEDIRMRGGGCARRYYHFASRRRRGWRMCRSGAGR